MALLADPSGYIFEWLVGYSGGLGSIAGVLIADYCWCEQTSPTRDLYRPKGAYTYNGGWNWRAWLPRCSVAASRGLGSSFPTATAVRLRLVYRLWRSSPEPFLLMTLFAAQVDEGPEIESAVNLSELIAI